VCDADAVVAAAGDLPPIANNVAPAIGAVVAASGEFLPFVPPVALETNPTTAPPPDLSIALHVADPNIVDFGLAPATLFIGDAQAERLAADPATLKPLAGSTPVPAGWPRPVWMKAYNRADTAVYAGLYDPDTGAYQGDVRPRPAKSSARSRKARENGITRWLALQRGMPEADFAAVMAAAAADGAGPGAGGPGAGGPDAGAGGAGFGAGAGGGLGGGAGDGGAGPGDGNGGDLGAGLGSGGGGGGGGGAVRRSGRLRAVQEEAERLRAIQEDAEKRVAVNEEDGGGLGAGAPVFKRQRRESGGGLAAAPKRSRPEHFAELDIGVGGMGGGIGQQMMGASIQQQPQQQMGYREFDQQDYLLQQHYPDDVGPLSLGDEELPWYFAYYGPVPGYEYQQPAHHYQAAEPQQQYFAGFTQQQPPQMPQYALEYYYEEEDGAELGGGPEQPGTWSGEAASRISRQ